MAVTPNMNLLLPDVGETISPTWGVELNEALGVEGTGVDGHDHTSGKGVPITPAGMNINADVDYQENSATNLLSVDFVDQEEDIGGTNRIFVLDGDFYMIDGDGTSVRITENGAISAASFGAITGLTSPASASFAGDTFTWLYDTNKYALMASGPLLLRRDGETSPNRIKITPPASLASGYDLTLPGALPASNAYLYSDSAGTLAFTTTALSNSVNTAAIQSEAVTTAKIAALNVTRAKIEAVGQQVSSADSSLTAGTATTFTAITNFNVSITVSTLRPIVVMCYSSSTGGYLRSFSLTAGGYTNMRVRVTGASGTSDVNDITLNNPSEANTTSSMPASALNCIFVPTVVGVHTFTVVYAVAGADIEASANGNRIAVYQL